MRDGRLQGIEAIVEGQQRMATKGDDQRFLVGRQHRRVRGLRPIGQSSTLIRVRHFATVLGLIP